MEKSLRSQIAAMIGIELSRPNLNVKCTIGTATASNPFLHTAPPRRQTELSQMMSKCQYKKQNRQFLPYSTVTLLARFRGLSTSSPFATLT